MLAAGGRRERNRMGVIMMKAEEDEKENVGAGAVGAVQGSRLLPLSRPQPLSDVEDYAAAAAGRHHPHNYAPSFLPEILGGIKPSASNKGQSSSPLQSAPFWTYAAGHGGSVEHWKKLARKAELEMHLEQEQHKSDREKDLDSIHRLRCRISVLEAAAIDRDMMIEKQRRKICSLKSQLGGVNQRFGKEITPESVQQSTNMKGFRKGWKKQGATEADETTEGFDDFTTSKGDRQIVMKDMTGCSLMKKRQAKNSMAGKILQLRSENSFLVKEYLSRGVLVDTLVKSETKGKESLLNPLRKLAVFQVDLLVNTKAHKLLEVGGITGGLSQAAIHYFTINQQAGEMTFENGNPPGSQSSNMLAELMLLSGSESPIYETNAGDVLGLAVKVKGLNDKNPREILYNTSVIRTDEVMEAIKGQPIDNFSLWPDLVSSWKWERSSSKGWVLVCIKWRFLFKNIFPEISEPLQVLAIKQGT
ncbi:hypothetical protein GOP47_0011712 [Adiantum capillus-veneris]|uniref:Uncharacterized protein n=1 Tax=Adiantum capillus-veneris TaxID=13818 RepID=A0A9D4UTA5_ADICA|nr:hypothetical protein GOP47_0011712 [Adiantum capillus-veneris]